MIFLYKDLTKTASIMYNI